MAVRGWFSRAFLIAALLAPVPASADGPAPKTPRKADLPAPSPAEASRVFRDPKGRFSIRHSDDWVVMLNWGGGPELVCRWSPCRESALSTCIFFSMPWEQGEFDPLLLSMLAITPEGGIDMGPVGKVSPRADSGIRMLGGKRWTYGGLAHSLFGAVELEGATWATIEGNLLIMVRCTATKSVWPSMPERIEALLAGVTVTPK